MKFSGPDSTSFELSIVDYHFPELHDVEYDSNWLIIRVVASLRDESWTVTDPSLLTYEMSELADWLDQVAQDVKTAPPDLYFIEPCLGFSILTSGNVWPSLVVHLRSEPAPPSITDSRARVEGVELVFSMESIDLSQVADDLRRQLQAYPQRTEQ